MVIVGGIMRRRANGFMKRRAQHFDLQVKSLGPQQRGVISKAPGSDSFGMIIVGGIMMRRANGSLKRRAQQFDLQVKSLESAVANPGPLQLHQEVGTKPLIFQDGA